MKPEEAPCSVLRRVEVSSSRCLRDEGTTHTETYPLLGGVFSDTKLSWLSRGPTLEVINTKDGSVVARWTFGAVIKDFSTKVTCIEEYKQPALNRMPQPLLQTLVGLECELTGGMVCVFNFTGPRVLRAINIPSKVTSMALISPGMEATSLHPLLEPMDGIVAVGTKEGHIFLLDLRRADCQNDLSIGSASHWENLHDELRPCQVIHARGGGVEQRMKECPNDHLCLHLNLSAFSHFKRFVVQFPRGDCKQFLPDDSSVTSMSYVPGLSSLIVGFTFGSFQIWSLKTLTHLYTCPTGGGPVERILFQEPCDDPNACCFVWISRGLSSVTPNPDSANAPSAVMYTLSYDEKLWVHECGNVFNNFISCNTAFRFEFDEDEDTTGGRIIGMRTIEQPIRTPLSSAPDDNTLGSSTVSLCLLVWETWGASGPPEGLDPANTYMALFDLNQWYVDHMPPRLSSRGGVSRNKTIAGYVSKYRLGETLCDDNDGVSTLGILMDVNIDPTSLLPFTTVQNVEEHSRPAALQFRSIAFLERQVVHITHPGIQRALLATLTSTGPSLLLTPTYVFHQCLALGLRPLQYDVPDCVNMELVEQRSYVILVALEHRLTRWLSACARECSDGRMEGAGLTLAWFLNVLWSRLADLKRTAVQLCVQLFDYSGLTLDSNASRQLRHIVAVLRVLKSLFDNVTKEKWHLRLMDSYHIELQKGALDMEVQYYEALQWFVGTGLLPEIPENFCVLEDSHVPYPAKSIIDTYTARRTELQELYKCFAEEVDDDECDSSRSVSSRSVGLLTLPQDLLMIDGLISHQSGGKRLQSEWERDAGKSGGRFANMYPPASIQGLLRTYLIRNISYDIKTSIVTYIFMDLAASLDTDKWANNFHRFMQFPSAFNMSPSIIKLTQAFWHLDHRSFDLALEMLLDPLISCKDIEMWQHRSVVRALMLQGQHRLALRYLSAREPPLNSDHDIRIRVNLLLSNDLVNEAFMFQRDFRSAENSQSLLEYFFKGCAKRQLLSSILQLKLTEEEEAAFVSFLESNKDMISEDLHVLYLLKRFRYVEAFDVNQRLRKAALESGRAVGSFQDDHGSTRDIVVNALYKTLPGVTRLLAAHCAQERSKVGTWKQVKRPTPLSVDVRQCQPDVKLKLPFIETALAKTREAWARVLPQTPPATESKSFVEQTPFLCTPRTKVFNLVKTTSDSPLLAKTNPSKKRSREEDPELWNLPASKLSRSASFPAMTHHNADPPVDGSTGVLTPIVKRQSPNSRLKSRLLESGDPGKAPMTPTSIIKSRGSIGLTKSPMRMASHSPSRSRGSSQRPYRSLSKSLLAQPDTPEQTRPILATKPPVFCLDVELSDDDEEPNASVKGNVTTDNSVISADKSVSDSVISADLESDHEGTPKYSDLEPFSLPVNTPPLVRSPAQKRVSLSNMVVKANFLASTASWSTPGNRSSVTFGDNMVCVYDKDEPASTATNSSEFSPSADEDSRETDQSGSFEDSRDENSRDGESSRDGEDSRDGHNLRDEGTATSSLEELRKRCHERVKPRSSSIEDLNKSFEGSPELARKVSSLDNSTQEETSERDEVVEVVEEENDFDTEPVYDIGGSSGKAGVTSQKEVEDTDQDGSVEVTDDDSNDVEMFTRKQGLSTRTVDNSTAPEEEAKDEKQESSLLFPLRCALLSPLFRNQLSRKRAEESLKGTPVKVVETSAVAIGAVSVPEDEDVVDIADSEKESNVSDSEDLGEVPGEVGAESLISNDLDSDEEEAEEQPSPTTFWGFRLPLRSPSPAKAKTPERRPSLSNRVLLSETLKRCHKRVKPRPATFPEAQIYVQPEDSAKETDEEGGDVASTSIPREETDEVAERSVTIPTSVHSTKSGSDFEVTETTSHNTSAESDVLILSHESISDDDSRGISEEGEEPTATEAVEESDFGQEGVLSNTIGENEQLERNKEEEDEENKEVGMERDSEEEMEELRVGDSEDEEDFSIVVPEDEPLTPPNVVSLAVASTAMRTPRSARLNVIHEGETPRSDKKSLKRTRLTEMSTFSGVRTRKASAAEPGGSPTLSASPLLAGNNSSPGTEKVTPEEQITPHRTRSSGPVELPVDEKTKSTRKVASANVVKETDVQEGTPRRTRRASVAKEVEVHEGTPRRTRSASVATEVEVLEGTPSRTTVANVSKEVDVQEGTTRKTRGASVAKEVEVQEGTPSRTTVPSVSKEVEVQEGTPRKTRGANVSKEVEVQVGTPRKTRGASVAKEVEVQEGTPRKTRTASVAMEMEVQEGTPSRTTVPSASKEVVVQEGTTRKTRGASVAKEVEVQEGTPRKTRGASVAKEVEVQEGTPRRTRGASLAKEVEVQEGTPRRTRGASLSVEVPASVTRRTRGSSVAKDSEEVETTPRRTKAASVLTEVSEDEVPPVSSSPSASESKDTLTPSRRTRSSGDLKEGEEAHLTPRVTRRHAKDEERPSTPRQTRSSSVLKESEPSRETQPTKTEVEPKRTGRGRSSSVAKEMNAETSRKTRGSSVLKDVSPVGSSSSAVMTRRTRGSSVMSEKEDTPSTPKTSSDSPQQKKADGTGKKNTRTRRGKTSELDSSFESKDGDAESVYSKRSNASHVNSPDSIASRTRTRVPSVSSVESSRKPSKSTTRKRKSSESSQILQEKLAQISGSEASAEEKPSKRLRAGTPQSQHREDSVARSIHSEVTERLNRSESSSEYAAVAASPKKPVDLVSRDRIEAAIQEYSSTRRLTRKQQALLSRSIEICAQPERFQQAVMASAVSDVEEEDDDNDGTRSVSSVRSSVRLRRKRGGEGPPSPTSTATTEILPGNEKGVSRRISRRTSASCTGSPSSVVSGASGVSSKRGIGRSTAAQRLALLKQFQEMESSSTEIETSSQASSRKNTKGSRTSSVTLEEEPFSQSYPAEFSEPQYPASDVGSVGNVSPYREGFTFSQPPIEAVEEDSCEAPAPRRTRPSKIAPQPTLGPIREESQTSTEKDSISSKASSNDKRRSWHLFTPATEKELALAAKKQRQKQRKSKAMPVVTSAFPNRNRSEIFKFLLDNDDESDN